MTITRIHSNKDSTLSEAVVPAGNPDHLFLGIWVAIKDGRYIYSLPTVISLFPPKHLPRCSGTPPDQITSQPTMFAWFNAQGQHCYFVLFSRCLSKSHYLQNWVIHQLIVSLIQGWARPLTWSSTDHLWNLEHFPLAITMSNRTLC